MVHEIVSFKFKDGSTVQQQREQLALLGRWVATQPGFVERSAFHDAAQGRWVDFVTWRDLPSANAAMQRSLAEPSLAPVMAGLDQSTMSLGHFERLL